MIVATSLRSAVYAFMLLPAVTQAKSSGEFYSKINVNAQSSEEGEGRFSEIRSNNSWIGVKGNYDLENDIAVVYRLEWKVDITAEDNQDTLTERPQYVGLATPLGELTLGRNFTALWMAQGNIDLFNHYEGDIAALWEGENRLSDVATYTSPSFRNTRVIVTYQAEKSANSDAATSAGIFYGDKSLKKTNLFAAIAHDFDVEGYDVTRASAQYKLNQLKLGVIAQTQQPSLGGKSEQGATISASYRYDQIEYRAQYQTLEDDRTINIGADYHLSANTKVYTWYSLIDKEEVEDRNYLAIGFQHTLAYAF